jgi:aspartyl/asparaginyl beta-hydroxylase (cupin superfamily)
VANKWHSWRAGTILLFDDSYEHEVRNDSDQERIVLLLRVWHPAIVKPGSREQYLYEARSNKEQAVEKRYHPPN